MSRMQRRREERAGKIVLLTALVNLAAALIKLIDSLIEKLR